MEYDFKRIEKEWEKKWKEQDAYKVYNPEPGKEPSKPKYYVLDMFPYPSGTGLHVGHPLGYIASDIYSRYKRLKGFNVLHPMGFDSFGLPAEQYALETGQHPAETTKYNIQTFKSQMNNVGFSFDWDREVRTSDPAFYKWTQWIFLQLFGSFYNRNTHKAAPIADLIAMFEKEGNKNNSMPNPQFAILNFSAAEWKGFDDKTQQDILMQYRLAYCGYGEVNWCEALGTVLANDEVINGVSERGSHPVVKKKLRQWYLRITEYADRLLEGLGRVDFSEAMKEMQTNWIGKSSGAEIEFGIENVLESAQKLRVYTTRPDTIFGVDFMVIAPEHELVEQITTGEQKSAVDEYIAYVKSRSERERMAEKKITGVFTGAYAINPFDERRIPVWISEYVLAGYGTGAIMAVPCGDERDFKFAHHFNIPVTNIIGKHFNGEEANPTKDAVLENSGFLNGLLMKEAMEVAIIAIEEKGIGVRKVNYKMRDAAFSRQRYWGEPFPIIWKDGIAYPLDEKDLPLVLPEVNQYTAGPDGEGPLANLPDWFMVPGGIRETNTMPGYAGSSWYFLRYMDPDNQKTFCDRTISDYWNQVDLYVGGTEHAVGHLLYSRLWTKVLYDLGYIGFDEPFKKLMNQGMIQGSSRFVYRVEITGIATEMPVGSSLFVSFSYYHRLSGLIESGASVTTLLDYLINEVPGIFPPTSDMTTDADIKVSKLHVDVNIVDGIELDIPAFRQWRPEYKDAILICDDGTVNSSTSQKRVGDTDAKYICGSEVEKMSKSKYNTINPDDLVARYGADTFRMYEMFLGPVEMSKPWDTKGIEGVHRFLKKLWRLFYRSAEVLPKTGPQSGHLWTDEKPTAEELKILHRTIKKIEDDTERFSFNTGVSSLMIAVNELTDLHCHKKEILEPLLILLTPYAPHIAEELYAQLRGSSTTRDGHPDGVKSILDARFPVFRREYVIENSKEYPVSINGKMRTTMDIALTATQDEVEKVVLQNETVKKWMEGKPPKKIIYVKNKMVNVVV